MRRDGAGSLFPRGLAGAASWLAWVGLQTEMLLRVVAEETDTEFAVVTRYKTSKLGKYLGGQNP